MSRYATVLTQFKDRDSLLSALMETGKWTLAQIEVHEVPQHLYGFQGDERKETAHIIIRQQHVGGSSNDLGFIRNADGQYEVIISEYDSSKYSQAWIGQLKGNYAYHRVRREQESRGRTTSRVRCPNGHQTITVTGYR